MLKLVFYIHTLYTHTHTNFTVFFRLPHVGTYLPASFSLLLIPHYIWKHHVPADEQTGLPPGFP